MLLAPFPSRGARARKTSQRGSYGPAIYPAAFTLGRFVDDDEIVRRSVRQALEPIGWQVTEAENGQIAVEACCERAKASCENADDPNDDGSYPGDADAAQDRIRQAHGAE
jgi:hypothetical protein